MAGGGGEWTARHYVEDEPSLAVFAVELLMLKLTSGLPTPAGVSRFLLADLPNLESTPCRVCVSICFLSLSFFLPAFLLYCIFNSNVNCFCVYKYSSSVFPEPTYIYCTVYTWPYTGKGEWSSMWFFLSQCDFFFEIIFLKTLRCKRFPCCHRSFIMRPKIGKRARVWFFYSFASFPLFFFFLNPIHIRGVPYEHEQINSTLHSVLAGSTGAACVRRIYCFHSV